MRRGYISSKVFQKTFLFFWIILLIPITIFSLGFAKTLKDDNIRQMANIHNLEAQKTAGQIDRKFMEIDERLNELRNLNWIYKYVADTDVFADEFTILDKVEYCNDLQRYGYAGTAGNISILYPYRNAVVSANNWYTTEAFLSWNRLNYAVDFSGILERMEHGGDADYEKAAEDVLVLENYIVIVKSLEIAKAPRVYAMFYWNRQSFQGSIEQMIGFDTVGVNMLADGTRVLSAKNRMKIADTEMHKIVKNSILPGWSYEFVFRFTYSDAYVSDLNTLLLITACSFLSGTAMAYLFSLLSYKPLYNLLTKIQNGPREALRQRKIREYQLIEMSFDSIRAENDRFRENAERHRQALKNNILMRLIKGYFEGQSTTGSLLESFHACGIAYREEHYFCVCIVHNAAGGKMQRELPNDKNHQIVQLLGGIEQYMGRIRQSCNLYEAINDELVAILSFEEEMPGPDRLDQIISGLRDHVGAVAGAGFLVSAGELYQGFIGISKSYCAAREGADRPAWPGALGGKHTGPEEVIYYYPTDWEIQLITNLKLGNEETVRKILEELILENEKRELRTKWADKLSSLLEETMLRVLYESNIDADVFRNELDTILSRQEPSIKWRDILELGVRICRKKASEGIPGTEQARNNEMVCYVDAHFHYSDLSLQALSDRFGMSLPAISKAFKECTGIKFMDYVTRLRIEKAKVLLQAKCYDMRTIASMVGYESEYSFKRAFYRYEERKPGDYVKEMSFSSVK